MINEFINAYCDNLKNIGFGVIHETERFIELQNTYGQAANIGVIINADMFEDLKAFTEEYSSNIANRAESSKLKNIFLVFVIVNGGDRPDVYQLLEQAEVYDSQRIYSIYWSVVPSEESCIFNHNKKQPGEIGGMSKAIAATFRDESTAAALMPVNRHVFITYILISINGAVFALMGMILPSNDPYRIITAGAIVPEMVFAGEYWRLLSAMFIHFDAAHLIANCLSLYIFGTMTERFLGAWKLLVIYFGAGLLASTLCLSQANAVSAGASGAAYGLIGATAIITWRAKGRVMLNTYNMILLICVGIGVSLIVPGISYTAHIGGLVAGLILGLALVR